MRTSTFLKQFETAIILDHNIENRTRRLRISHCSSPNMHIIIELSLVNPCLLTLSNAIEKQCENRIEDTGPKGRVLHPRQCARCTPCHNPNAEHFQRSHDQLLHQSPANVGCYCTAVASLKLLGPFCPLLPNNVAPSKFNSNAPFLFLTCCFAAAVTAALC